MRIALVAGVVVDHDAISSSVVRQAQLLAAVEGVESVTIYTQGLGRDVPVPSHVVGDPWSLVRHRQFRDADVAVFHWGIRYSLFDALTLLAAQRPRPVVHFHNLTPAELVPESQRATIERSLEQFSHALALRVPLWTMSEFNRRTLVEWGADPATIEFVPICIDAPPGLVAAREEGRVQLICIGRLTSAKGQHVLIEALHRLDPTLRDRLHLRFVSSATFSDDAYLAELRALVAEHDLDKTVTFEFGVDDDELWRLLGRSHVLVSPTFHEGLCVPVLEAYLAGCRVVATDAGNLPYLVGPPDRLVGPGDADALAAALTATAEEVLAGGHRDDAPMRALAAEYSSPSCTDRLVRVLGLQPNAHPPLPWPTLQGSDR